MICYRCELLAHGLEVIEYRTFLASLLDRAPSRCDIRVVDGTMTDAEIDKFRTAVRANLVFPMFVAAVNGILVVFG